MDFGYLILVVIIVILTTLIKPAFKWFLVQRIVRSGDNEPRVIDVVSHLLSERLYKVFVELINRRQSLVELFYRVGLTFSTVFDSDGFSVLLTPGEKGWKFIAWDHVYDKNDLDSIAMSLESLSDTNIHEVVRTKRVVVIPDTSKYSKWEKKESVPALSWMGIPIVDEGKVIGVISIDWFRKYGPKRWMVNVSERMIGELESLIKTFRDVREMMESVDLDPVIGVPNVNAFKKDFERLKESGRVGVMSVKILNMQKIEKVYGRKISVEFLKKVYDRLSKIVQDKGKVYLYSSGVFVIIINKPSAGYLINLERKITFSFLRVIEIFKEDKVVFFKANVEVKHGVYPENGDSLESLMKILEI